MTPKQKMCNVTSGSQFMLKMKHLILSPIVASHLCVADDDILDPDILKEKSESDNPILSVLREMMDFEIMLNPLFVLICISNILGERNHEFTIKI